MDEKHLKNNKTNFQKTQRKKFSQSSSEDHVSVMLTVFGCFTYSELNMIPVSPVGLVNRKL